MSVVMSVFVTVETFCVDARSDETDSASAPQETVADKDQCHRPLTPSQCVRFVDTVTSAK